MNKASIALVCALVPFAAQAAPSVSWRAPTSGATISGNIYQSSACEVTGSNIDRVRFYIDGALLNTEENAPWNCNIDTRRYSNGTHTLRAVAYDSAGATASRSISVNIQNGNTPPAVSLTSPASGATVSGTAVACTASATDANGIRQVQFFLDGTALQTDTSSPYNCSFDSTRLTNGTHTLRAVATDNLGATSTAQISVNVSNTTSSIQFTAPAPGGVLSGNVQGPPNCTVTGTNVARIMFYLNDVWTNTDGNPDNGWGCWIDTTKYANGAYTVKAVAYNAAGQTTTVTHPIKIQNGNTPPSVSFASPASGATLSGTAAAYAANASDSDGSVAKVDIYVDTTLVATRTAAPYSGTIDTTAFTSGAHTLRAVATDNQGAATATQISVTIANGATSNPGGGTSGIDPADVIAQPSADLPFAEQSKYNVQVIGTAPYVTEVAESGIHYTALANGETLRFGKVVDPQDSLLTALAAQVHRNDPVTSGAKRTEMRITPDHIEYDKVYWVALSLYVYDWGTLSSSDQALFGMQVHSGDNSLGLSPSIALVSAYNGNGRSFQVFTVHSTSTSPSTSNQVSARYATQPIPFGRWVDFVFKFRHNISGNGFAQVWMDGNLIAEHRGNLGFWTPGYKDYLKFGYYNWSGANMGSTARKVLLRSPTIVADPTGKYSAEDLRAHIRPAP